MDKWQDIETAPKDGSEFLAYGFYIYPGDTSRTEYMSVATYDEADKEFPWSDLEGNHPDGYFSDWMPLPDSPADGFTMPDKQS